MVDCMNQYIVGRSSARWVQHQVRITEHGMKKSLTTSGAVHSVDTQTNESICAAARWSTAITKLADPMKLVFILATLVESCLASVHI